MKEFVKTMLAVICGFIVIRIIGFIFMLILFGSALATGGGKASFPKSGVLDINLADFTLAEQTEENPMPSGVLSSFSMNMVPALGVRDAVQAIRVAADDPGIRYILLRADGMTGGMADAEEFRMALSQFRESGKAVSPTPNPLPTAPTILLLRPTRSIWGPTMAATTCCWESPVPPII